VGKLNVEGDGQGDLAGHGGEHGRAEDPGEVVAAAEPVAVEVRPTRLAGCR